MRNITEQTQMFEVIEQKEERHLSWDGQKKGYWQTKMRALSATLGTASYCTEEETDTQKTWLIPWGAQLAEVKDLHSGQYDESQA